jgi:hypothetical protein
MADARYRARRDRRHASDVRHVPSLRHQRDPRRKVDLSKTVPSREWPIWDQGPYQSCTAHAVAAVATFARIKAKLPRQFQLSRRFLYHCELQAMLRNHNHEPGTVPYAADILSEVGICADRRAARVPTDAVWPYPDPATPPDPRLMSSRPPQGCFDFAGRHRMRMFSRRYLTQRLAHLRGCLAEGHPFTFLISLYESFSIPATIASGDIPLPPLSPMPAPPGVTPPVDNPTPDSHAMVVVGYDDVKGRFLVRNSMGTTWGRRGYGTIPYDYVLNSELCDPNSFWTLRLRKRPIGRA